MIFILCRLFVCVFVSFLVIFILLMCFFVCAILIIEKTLKERGFMKKILCAVLALTMGMSMAGCSGKKTTEKTGNVTITVGNWPDKNANPPEYETWENNRTEFMKKYPDITIERDSWNFSIDSFLPKAAGNQLPTIFRIPYTEIDKVIEAGYAADLTDKMKEYGYTDNLSDKTLGVLQRDGKIYMIPINMYALGLVGNRKVFEEAGLLNDDGTIPYPRTLDDLAELAGKIKEKTGKAGFILPTMKNNGGWHFMSIAWSYGVNFMEKENGKWVAKFNSPEFVNALQFVYDLKWKYNALSDNALIDGKEGQKMLAGGQGALYIAPSDTFGTLVTEYGMDKDDISIGKIPAGPKGQYALMGGNLYMVPKGATEEQIDAVFKWAEFNGSTPKSNEAAEKTFEQKIKKDNELNKVVLEREPFKIYKSGGMDEFKEKILKQYANVNVAYYKEYFDMDNVNIKAEEPVNCQQLYSILDNCIQSILTNKDINLNQLAENAAGDFQKNYLDNITY